MFYFALSSGFCGALIIGLQFKYRIFLEAIFVLKNKYAFHVPVFIGI